MAGNDIVVVGAGPAGIALAVLLAREGVSVKLVDGGAPKATLEGYSARTVARLRALGLSRTESTLSSELPRIGRWAHRAVVGTERVGDRAQAHQAMLDDAAAARVQIEHARWTQLDTQTALKRGCRLVVDARGRHGPAVRGPLLIAMAAQVPSRHGQAATTVGSWSEGWFWLVDTGATAQIQLVCRPRACRPGAWPASLGTERPDVADWCALARGRWVARPAYARLTRLTDPLLAVGDAALAVDPLSGHGIFEALRSADVHASAVRTLLAGGSAGLVRRYVTDRRAETWARTVAAAADLYSETSEDIAFWQECASHYRKLAATATRPEVMRSRIELCAVLEDGYIREKPVIVTSSNPRGAWKVAGVPLVELYEFLRTQPMTRLVLEQAACRFEAPISAIRAAARWLSTSGLALSVRAAS